jgi:ribosome-associated protein
MGAPPCARPQRRTTLVKKKSPAKKPAVKKTAAPKTAKKATKKAAKKTTKKAAPKKAAPKKAAPKKTAPQKAAPKKTVPQKAAPKKAAPRKTAPKKTAPKKVAAEQAIVAPQRTEPPEVLARILASLDDDKAEEIVAIDLAGRSSLCDAVVVASGRSSRHVASIADHLARRLKEAGYGTRPVNGAGVGDWALVDAGDVIVHIFRPEVRAYYNLEGMWSVDEPKRSRH